LSARRRLPLRLYNTSWVNNSHCVNVAFKRLKLKKVTHRAATKSCLNIKLQMNVYALKFGY